MSGVEPFHPIMNTDPDTPIIVRFSGGSVTLKPGETLTFDPLGNPVVTKEKK